MPTFRERSLRLGAMRERITIQRKVETVDSIGQTIRTWETLYCGEPARYDPVSGGETIRGKQVEAGVTVVFTIHRRDAIDTTCRVVHNGTTYGISYIEPIDGGRRYLTLKCAA